jgi:putative ABC transport system ATP-binding protein
MTNEQSGGAPVAIAPAPDSRRPRTGTVLEGIALSKVYRMGEVEVHALRGVDLRLIAGEFLVLLGPSGSGKSTLLNILGGLDVPTGGRVFYRDRELTTADESELTRYRRHHVGFVFQFYNLIPSLTARENVALVTDIARRPFQPEEVLELVGLGDRLDHFPAQLSGGEPTGALDCHTGRIVLEALVKVNREIGTTTAVITHNAAIAAIGDRVVTLGDGRIVREERHAAKASVESVRW